MGGGKILDNQAVMPVVMDEKTVTEKLKFPQDTTTPLGCIAGSPMMEFGTGSAPVLDYEIPQKTSFATYGTNEITPLFAAAETENDVFMDIAFAEPLSIKSFPVTTPETQYDPYDGTRFVANGVINTSFQTNNNQSYGVSNATNRMAGGQTTIPTTQPSNIPSQQFISQELALGNVIVIEDNFGGFGVGFTVIPRPNAGRSKPTFFLVEEYSVASYLANYGAGKTLNTFTLLPAEKTSISIRTYKESIETKKRAENVMDSFSKDSAEEFEKTLEKENSTQLGNSATSNFNTSLSLSASLTVSLPKFGIGGGTSLGIGMNGGRSATSNRQANVRNMAKSIEKHANKTNSSRKVEVSSSSENSQKEGEEMTTVRNLINPNQSRVLNFVFRQLLQEYITIMYLSNVKVGFSNGHPESQLIVPIEKLDELLATHVKPAFIDRMRTQIIFEYLTVTNYQGFNQAFLEKVIKPTYSPTNPNATVEFYSKRKSLADTYELALGNRTRTIRVDGIILSVEKNTLFTDSVIVDSLLGQGEALDCFNAKMQDATAEKVVADTETIRLQNQVVSQAVKFLETTGDDSLKADVLKALLGKNQNTNNTINNG